MSSAICRVLGGNPPVGFTYELFLDDKGEKISKSRGNVGGRGLASPRSAGKFRAVHVSKADGGQAFVFDVIPKNVDEYLNNLAAFPTQDEAKLLGNPVFHIHRGEPPRENVHIGFNIPQPGVRLSYGRQGRALGLYRLGPTRRRKPRRSWISWWSTPPTITCSSPTAQVRRAPTIKRRDGGLEDVLSAMPDDGRGGYSGLVHEIGKAHIGDLKSWFRPYQVLLGQTKGRAWAPSSPSWVDESIA